MPTLEFNQIYLKNLAFTSAILMSFCEVHATFLLNNKLPDVHYNHCLKNVLVTFLSDPGVDQIHLIQVNKISLIETGKNAEYSIWGARMFSPKSKSLSNMDEDDSVKHFSLLCIFESLDFCGLYFTVS